MSTKKKLRKHGFVYKDLDDVRVIAHMQSVTGKGRVKVQKNGEVIESFTTRSPAAQFEGLIEKYR